MNNRRVWPELVSSSLNWHSVSTSTKSYSTAVQNSQKCPNSHKAKAVSFGSNHCLVRLKQLRPSRRSTVIRCNERTSDIFGVAGAITAITGSLIASFGVYPRNQARLRLFLECVGCAMVIAGVLIFLVSLRMRPRNRVVLSRRDSRCADSQSISSVPLQTVGEVSRELLDYRLAEVSAESGGQVALVERAWPASSRRRIGESKQQGSKRQQFLSTWLLTGAELEPESDALSCDNQDWTPAGGYGAGHQAAIETALSTVLTVSTLVGFRAHQANPNHCCLHHAVQLTKQKVSAQNLIRRLRKSRHNESDAQQQPAETTLMMSTNSLDGASNTRA